MHSITTQAKVGRQYDLCSFTPSYISTDLDLHVFSDLIRFDWLGILSCVEALKSLMIIMIYFSIYLCVYILDFFYYFPDVTRASC